jgi:hypothetical protein
MGFKELVKQSFWKRRIWWREARIFFFFERSRPAVGHNQPPIQYEEVFFRGKVVGT